MSKVFGILCVTALTALASADWVPGDGHKMHFPQLPDLDGWDVESCTNYAMADDWQCSGSGPVEDIHWWGSWKYDETGAIYKFIVRIYSNIPAGGGQQFSKPGDLLWSREFTAWTETPFNSSPLWQGYYRPSPPPAYWSNNHQLYYQYNLEDITDPFEQVQGEIYWLCIQAQVEMGRAWGWKSSEDHFMDDAVMGYLWGSGDPGWTPLYEPPGFTQSLDLAFVITPEPATLSLLAVGGLTLLRRRQ
jgi:hypothetical protein